MVCHSVITLLNYCVLMCIHAVPAVLILLGFDKLQRKHEKWMQCYQTIGTQKHNSLFCFVFSFLLKDEWKNLCSFKKKVLQLTVNTGLFKWHPGAQIFISPESILGEKKIKWFAFCYVHRLNELSQSKKTWHLSFS